MTPENTDKRTILLAEDDPDDSLLFTLAADVLSTPVQISLAEDGEMMLKYLEHKHRPDFIFMDLRMPKRSGLECLRELKSRQEYLSIPVIIYSTSMDQLQIDRCYEAGADLYAVKPANFQNMVKLLKKIVNHNFTQELDREHFLFVEKDL